MTTAKYYEVYMPSSDATFSDGRQEHTAEGYQKCLDKITELRKPKDSEYDEYWAKEEIRVREVTVTKKDVAFTGTQD